jgi:hypothetical protein
MDERGTLSDEVLDRQLRAALDVAPAPEFMARVRTSLAGEVPAAHWLRWSWVAATAAATVAAAVLVTTGLLSTPETPAPSRPERFVSATSAAPVAARRSDDTPAERQHRHDARGADRVRVPAAVVVQPARKFPDVLLSADEQRAIRMLVRLGQVSDSPDALREQAVAASSEPLPVLDIRAIEIEPLPQLALLE